MKHQYLPDDLQVRALPPPPALIWTDPFWFAYAALIYLIVSDLCR
jgi:hypothetical protein